jgi:hypothetical protein
VEEDRIRDDLKLEGPRVVTFNNVLKWGEFPLATALADLLRIIRHGIGCAVEIEFAVDMRNSDRNASPGEKQPPCLYVLQIRPQVQQVINRQVKTNGYPESEVLCHSDRALGHGQIDNIQDVVYVKQRELDSFTTPRVADEVGVANERLKSRGDPYLLIGPGRWGTSDPRLGIPVKWKQISGARLIVETSFQDRLVEPSLGTHFFHNITTFRIGYLTLTTQSEGQKLDLCWLDGQQAEVETEFVRHIHLDHPLRVYLDGRGGKATILKPASED